MSVRRGPDWIDFMLVVSFIIAVTFYMTFDLKSQVRDLQRRVGQLERQR